MPPNPTHHPKKLATALLYREHHSRPTQPHPPPEITCYRVSITNTKNHPRTHPKPPKIPPKTAPKPTQNHPKPAQTVPRPVRWVAVPLGFFLRRCPRGSRAAPPPPSRMAARGSPHGSPRRVFPFSLPSAPAPSRPVPPSALGFPSRSCAPAGSTSLAQVAVRVWTRVIPAGSGCRNPPRKFVATALYISSPLSRPLVFFSFSCQITTRNPPARVPVLRLLPCYRLVTLSLNLTYDTYRIQTRERERTNPTTAPAPFRVFSCGVSVRLRPRESLPGKSLNAETLPTRIGVWSGKKEKKQPPKKK